jgi:hypothetical protein
MFQIESALDPEKLGKKGKGRESVVKRLYFLLLTLYFSLMLSTVCSMARQSKS